MFGNRSKLMVIAAIMSLVGVFGICSSAMCAQEIVWEMDFTRLHFDWNGQWDKTAWWAYAMWYLDLPDWCYLWAWYGLGWGNLSSSTPTGKIDLYFYESQWGGQSSGSKIYLAINNMETLNIQTSAWYYQSLQFGSVVTHELAHSIYYYKANGFHYNDDRHFTTEALSYYIGSFIYPWHHYSGGAWHSEMTFNTVYTNYRNAVSTDGYLLSWYYAGEYYLQGAHDARWNNAWWMFNAAGYFMYNYSGQQNTKPISTLVLYLGAGYSMSSAYSQAFGVGIVTTQIKYTDTNDFYYYFYNYYWA